MEPLVSVVIPTRNRAGLLPTAVASVLGQSLADLELIVVDDASADGTTAWLRTLTDERVVAITLTRHGSASGARNAGLQRARAPRVMFLDDDDILRPRALETLVRALDRHPEARAAVGARWRFGSDVWNGGVRIPHPRRTRTANTWAAALAGWSGVSGQVLHRADSIRGLGGFDERLARAEDRDLWLRLGSVGDIVLVPEITVDYRVHGDQIRPPNVSQHHAAISARQLAGEPPARALRGRLHSRSGETLRRARTDGDAGRPARAVALFGLAIAISPRATLTLPNRPGVLADTARALRRAIADQLPG